MANFYKNLNSSGDIVNTRTLLHEAIPLTGTIVSGTYSDENIKNYTHGMFQSVYDYPYYEPKNFWGSTKKIKKIN